MAIIRNGKIYRNLQEQVLENTEDIEELWKAYGYNGPYASLEDITDPIDKALYLIGTDVPYEVYQYNELVQNYTDLGTFAAQGPEGPQGPQGERGPRGYQGEQGPRGIQGIQGPQGIQGERGLQGIQGEPGEQGPAGEDGQDGTDGITPHIGDNGDWYLGDIDTGVQAQGPQGETGPAGADGQDGLTTSISVNGNTYTQVGGTITLPDYADTTNMVTTDTNQQITGMKTFKTRLNVAYTFNEESAETRVNNNSVYINTGTEQAVYGVEGITYAANFNPTIQVNNTGGNNVIYTFDKTKGGTVAVTSELFSGDYDDLTNKPTIPDSTSDLVNDSGFITSQDLTGYVTTDTNQQITGSKHFTGGISVDVNNEEVFDTYEDNGETYTEVKGTNVNIGDVNTDEMRISTDNLTILADGGAHLDSPNGNYKFGEKPQVYKEDQGAESVYENVVVESDLDDYATTNYVDTTFETKADAFSGDYDDLTNKPSLSTVAITGDYDDLTDKPDLSVYAESADLATVATTGDYDDLTNKPTIPTNYLTTDTDQTISGKAITVSGPTQAQNAIYGFDPLGDRDNNTIARLGDLDDYVSNYELSTTLSSYQLKSEAFSGDYDDLSNKPDLTVYALSSTVASISSSVATNTSNIASLTSQITNLASLASQHTTQIGNLTSETTTLASLVSQHTSQISQLQTDVGNCVTLSQLSAYSPTSSYASVAFTGSYSDLSGLPTIHSYTLSTSSASALSSASLVQTYETLTFTYSDSTTATFNFLTTSTSLSTTTLSALTSATLNES